MTFKPCTATVSNLGFKMISTNFQGVHWVAALEVRITDDATGALINPVHVSYSANGDTLVFKTFYEAKEDTV